MNPPRQKQAQKELEKELQNMKEDGLSFEPGLEPRLLPARALHALSHYAYHFREHHKKRKLPLTFTRAVLHQAMTEGLLHPKAVNMRSYGWKTHNIILDWLDPQPELAELEKLEKLEEPAERTRRVVQLNAIRKALRQKSPAAQKNRIKPGHPGYSSAYAEVCQLVDNEIRWRQKAQELETRIASLKTP